jgi:hypothetical protein
MVRSSIKHNQSSKSSVDINKLISERQKKLPLKALLANMKLLLDLLSKAIM